MNNSRKRLEPEARRKQLIDVAIACYGELGVERAGHGDIAKRAGVSTATVFNYFGTRDVLTEAVFEAVYVVFRNMFAVMPSSGKTAQEQVENLASSYVLLVQEHPDALKVVLNWSSSFGQAVRPQFLVFQEWLLNGIKLRLHQRDVDQSDDARIILAAAYSYARMKLDNTPQDVLERFVSRIVETVY